MPNGPGDTPSRRRIFVVAADDAGSGEDAARKTDPRVADAPRLPPAGHRRGPDSGRSRSIEKARARRRLRRRASRWRCRPCWSAREFLFRVEQDPPGVAAEYRLSRQRPGAGVAAVVLPVEQHPGRRAARRWRGAASCTSRPCSSGRSGGCWRTRGRARWSSNFAAQWLHLRNLDSITPDMRLFPDFDDNLRQAFRRETELFVESILREDRSVLDLLSAELHVPQRAAGQALRHPARLRQPLPARGAGRGQRARRAAPPGQHPDGDLVRHPHVAGDSRQVDPRQPARHAAAAAAARRAGAEGQHGVGDACRCASGWPSTAPTPPVRRLPQPDGPGRLRARELRRGRPLAHRSKRASRSTPRAGLPDGSKFAGVDRAGSGAAARGRSCSSAR